MDILTLLISRVNDVLWTYILIIMLLGCAFWFTFKTNFVQFRMIREMIRLLGDSTGKTEGREHHISSFQAFAVSIASRVGTGNLAGVATAITLGGPGAVFWMWVIALFGTLSKILCKWKQDSAVSLFLYLDSVFKNKHKLIHNQAPVMNRLCPFLLNLHK